MEHLRTIETIDSQLEGIWCDVCGTYYTNIFEIQEFFRVNDVGGYFSIFGDGTKIMLDICQYCFKKKLGIYVRTIRDFDDYNTVQ